MEKTKEQYIEQLKNTTCNEEILSCLTTKFEFNMKQLNMNMDEAYTNVLESWIKTNSDYRNNQNNQIKLITSSLTEVFATLNATDKSLNNAIITASKNIQFGLLEIANSIKMQYN